MVGMEVRTVQITLSPELEEIVRSRIASGRNRDASEVIREALDLLRKKEERERDALRAAIELGDDDIRNGRVTAWSADFLPRLLREAEEMIAADQRASERGER